MPRQPRVEHPVAIYHACPPYAGRFGNSTERHSPHLHNRNVSAVERQPR
jgi:hypothetical protein